MLRRLPFVGTWMIVAVCSATASNAQQPHPNPVPTGATIGGSGFATITDAPPAPFTPPPPGGPKEATPEQIAAQVQFSRAARFQGEVNGVVHTIANHLRVAEKSNFVDLYFENEGEPQVVFRFLRNPVATLAKYTKDPRFVAAKADYSDEELRHAMDFMLATFREDRVIEGGGTGSKSNRADVEINIPEDEFWRLVKRKGVKIPEAVKLTFRRKEGASALNRLLPATIAPLIRIFPRSDRPINMLPSVQRSAKVVLKDGCFRSPDNDNALVLFPLGASLFTDRAGYLAYGKEEAPGHARVGEEIVFPGTIVEVTAPELVEPIHRACGAGKVIAVNGMRSAAADRAQDIVRTNFDALRDFRQMYGLTEAQAQKALEGCKRSNRVVCILAPPPPVMPGQSCPAGSKLGGGVCRTPEGHIRPIPNWIEDLIRG